jgi:hypothetical protein
MQAFTCMSRSDAHLVQSATRRAAFSPLWPAHCLSTLVHAPRRRRACDHPVPAREKGARLGEGPEKKLVSSGPRADAPSCTWLPRFAPPIAPRKPGAPPASSRVAIELEMQAAGRAQLVPSPPRARPRCSAQWSPPCRPTTRSSDKAHLLHCSRSFPPRFDETRQTAPSESPRTSG